MKTPSILLIKFQSKPTGVRNESQFSVQVIFFYFYSIRLKYFFQTCTLQQTRPTGEWSQASIIWSIKKRLSRADGQQKFISIQNTSQCSLREYLILHQTMTQVSKRERPINPFFFLGQAPVTEALMYPYMGWFERWRLLGVSGQSQIRFNQFKNRPS